ncbi:MAG: penicillin acylase family protein [Devosia sp.]
MRWNAYKVPFIEAQSDRDAAFALGMVHAHLRLGQMAIVRRIVQGRLSESAGPFLTDIDTAIRAFDFYRPAEAIIAQMPPASRDWAERYADGVNAYVAAQPRRALPHEFAVAGMRWEPWTVADSMAIGRASGVDLNWTVLLRLLAIEDEALRERIFRRVYDRPAGALAEGLGAQGRLERLARLGARHGRSGSNSFVVSPRMSATGAPLIANDPHLAIIFPNAWVLAGLRTPETAMVGMMVAGTPVFGFGRNETLAWGGTNLRATTSQLVDVSALPETAFSPRTHRVGRRYWFGARRTTRESPYGPVMSELERIPSGGRPFAVRWTGHSATDEVTALLRAMRARDVGEFRTAMETFAFPPQTFLAADAGGSIAKMVAAKVPARAPGTPPPTVVSPERSDAEFASFYTSATLPFERDPPNGYFASANDRPAPDGTRPFGGLFPQDERIRRLHALLAERRELTLADMAEIQQDVVSPLSLELLNAVRAQLQAATIGVKERAAADILLEWDGSYTIESQGAAVFEAFLTGFAPRVYEELGRADELEIYEALDRMRVFLIQDVKTLSSAGWQRALEAGLSRAAPLATNGTRWGDLHRIEAAHILSNVPVLGRRYGGEVFATPGSRETIHKTTHPLTDGSHRVTFGAQSRHLSDLSDPDANHFVLLGGQDGWLNSANAFDQVPLWREGRTIHMPITPAAVARAFNRTTVLSAGRTR